MPPRVVITRLFLRIFVMENTAFFLQYLANQPVKVETHFIGQQDRRRPLTDVADLLAEVKKVLPSKLGSVDLDELTLHLPERVDRSSLSADCFADSTGTTLDVGCLLSALNSLGSNSKKPLIIRNFNDRNDQGIYFLM